MENESQKRLRESLLQLRKELIQMKKLLHDSNAVIRECCKGFQTISDTGNTRVADVFLDGLAEDGFIEEKN